ncbi:MAG: type II secretion system protein GspG [Candidatus Omnitrophica bacterium]|nr:type II secretion system protein GspG [Candidatus Omnitrophota bacterium]MCM8806675.1 type II secretion system protein GspG [Candidatus Omnitrophota bacterium]
MLKYKNGLKGKLGITLIEIIVGILIILSIASASLPVLHKTRNKALITKTKSIIDSIEVALSVYETDFGDYPEWDGNGSKILVEVLQGPCNSDRWNGPYIRFKKKEIDRNGNIIDSWGNPIIYKYPQNEYNNVPFILISPGKDGKIGTEDDIGNW